MGKKITLSTRLLLEELVQKYGEKVRVEWDTILNILGCTKVTLYREFRLGLTKEDYAHKNYHNYKAEIAQKNKEEEVLRRERA